MTEKIKKKRRSREKIKISNINLSETKIEKETEDKDRDYENTTSIIKSDDDERKITGVVLEPNTFDAQKTTISEKVIEKAAEDFLSRYNKVTKLGLQHKDFRKKFDLLQSYIAQSDFSIKDRIIKKGSWIIVVKVLDDKIWEKVKKKEITGFSIGGKAKIKKLEKEAA